MYQLRNFREDVTQDVGIRVQSRPKYRQLWRSTSLGNLVRNSNRNSTPVYESIPLTINTNKYRSAESINSLNREQKKRPIWLLEEVRRFWNNWDTIVTVVLVAAKGLPPSSSDGAVHELFCKIRLGSETFKSKSVPKSSQPQWRERFNLHLYRDYLLKLSLWDKGRQKTFMGSCVIDLFALEKERTHEIWQKLDDGYGSVHLLLTMCIVRFSPQQHIAYDAQNKSSEKDLRIDQNVVGSLNVRIIRARGLGGKPSVYCTLELENEKIETYRTRSRSEPTWNKNYIFNVHDVTSVLKLKVHSSSLSDKLMSEFRGQASIPLLKIRNGETRWYALKNKNNRGIAKGNCPRILLQMNVQWDPVKATIKLFRPKETRHIEKPNRLDIPLLFKNLEFMVKIFNTMLNMNEHFKCLFEWNNRELSAISLLIWLICCYHLKAWMIPFFLLLIFVFFWIYIKIIDGIVMDDNIANNKRDLYEKQKDSKGLAYKINDIQETILTVSYLLKIVVSLVEKIKILLTFRVPFLSYVAMLLLGVFSATLYFVPFNYLLMLFGIYKFMRKYLNPDRILNNDLVDFISRIPDSRQLMEWDELNVPEPIQ